MPPTSGILLTCLWLQQILRQFSLFGRAKIGARANKEWEVPPSRNEKHHICWLLQGFFLNANRPR